MNTVIKVENLGKSYVLGKQKNSREDSLRDVITEKVKGAFRNTKSIISKKTPGLNGKSNFWALNDVNFEVKQGERIGIIGRNGAGKSTLLKLLSRITEPTQGRISINGRVASLLEVGTGFHPELSGRENIYLNGAILGMHRAEIKRKFDEIVDFSEVEKFLDTPVKRYSSGMYVRLAFAVAAYLESENLVVDEVLAVGDAQFQKKCLGKMENLSKEGGRTVLFVSHNMQAISTLCNRIILLDKGTIIQDGEASKVIQNYLMFETSKSGTAEWTNENALGDSMIKLRAVKILDQENHVRNHFFTMSKIRIQFDFEIFKMDNSLVVGFDLTNEEGTILFRSYHHDYYQDEWPELKKGLNSIYCDIPDSLLREGTYFISPKISLHATKWIINSDPLLSFEVELNHGVSPFWTYYNKTNRPGALSIVLPWKNAMHPILHQR
ncbi:MAG: ABC transporter ATP-binding protein [Ginsengibacter sp.]